MLNVVRLFCKGDINVIKFSADIRKHRWADDDDNNNNNHIPAHFFLEESLHTCTLMFH